MNKKHSSNCPCKSCVDKRFKAWMVRSHAAGLGAPTNKERLIPVRRYVVKAHYRRHPNYLRFDPDLRQAILDFVDAMREISSKAKKGTLLNKKRAA